MYINKLASCDANKQEYNHFACAYAYPCYKVLSLRNTDTALIYNNVHTLPTYLHTYVRMYIHTKQKQPCCKKSARPIRSHNGYKRPKTLISSKAKKLNISLRILLLE